MKIISHVEREEPIQAKLRRRLLLALSLIAVFGAAFVAPNGLGQQIFEVNSTAFTEDGVCDPLERGDGCTLREAITAANSNGNPEVVDTISFNIPGSGVHLMTTALPDITQPVIIDGYTQPGAAPNSLAVGNNAVLLIEINDQYRGLVFATHGSVVRGLAIHGSGTTSEISLRGNYNTVEGCYLGLEANGSKALNANFTGIEVADSAGSAEGNLIGGNAPAARNVISGDHYWGIELDGESVIGTQILGNYIGTDKSGTAALGNAYGVSVFNASSTSIGGSGSGEGNLVSGNQFSAVRLIDCTGTIVRGNIIGPDISGNIALEQEAFGYAQTGIGIGGSGNIIGGTEPNAGNLVSGNVGGISVAGNENLVQGNLVGTNAAGTMPIPNTGSGITISGNNNVIGGSSPGAGNVVSGNAGAIGIAITRGVSTSNGNIVQGNFVGTDRNRTLNLGNDVGIWLGGGPAYPSFNLIGGSSPAEANTIAFNHVAGVLVIGGVEGPRSNQIFGNSIYRNNGLGIDLSGDGVTLNDLRDSDDGPNALQNFPAFSGFTEIGGFIFVNGTLDSLANAPFTIDFYSNSEVDPSGYGEGEAYLGAQDVLTDSAGHASFSYALPPGVTAQYITSTATDTAGNTSEFSAASAAVPTATPPPTPTPTPTSTPSPTATVTPTSTPSPTLSPSPSVTTTPTPTPSSTPSPSPGERPAEALNISTRAEVGTGDRALIGGFIVSGNSPKKVIVRAIGPSLGGAGLQAPLADPVLELHMSDGTVVTNDNWRTGQEAAIIASGLPPTNDLESAIVRTLDPGSYTAIVRGKNGAVGIGLVEVYDLDQAADSHLANISTRGFIETDENVLIGGIIVGPIHSPEASMLVRALGPSLTDLGVSNALADPMLTLHNGDGDVIAANDNWKTAQKAAIVETGIPPNNDKESALVVSLAPGNYTAVVSGAGDRIGIGLVEAYRLDQE